MHQRMVYITVPSSGFNFPGSEKFQTEVSQEALLKPSSYEHSWLEKKKEHINYSVIPVATIPSEVAKKPPFC